jgi:Ca-activated chloride channel homolog
LATVVHAFNRLFATIRNLVLLACVFAITSISQNAPAFRSGIELVSIPCTVVDSNGAAVAGLTRDEFSVYDNGVMRTLQDFWLDADLPLTLGVIIDASESNSRNTSGLG